MIVTIIILSVLSIILIFTTLNLLRKNEAYEDVVEEQEVLIADIASKIDSSMKQMKDLTSVILMRITFVVIVLCTFCQMMR